MFKILVFAFVVFFAIGAEAQGTIPTIPVSDSVFADEYEEFVSDIIDEPTIEIEGALCFHAESLSVSERQEVESYAAHVGLEFSNLCLKGEKEKGEYLPITVWKSFLSIPGTYITKEQGSFDHLTVALWAFVLGVATLAVFLAWPTRRYRRP